MKKSKSPFRRPTADEQTVLLGMTVKLLVQPKDIQKCDQILLQHHYLHSAQLVGEQLRYAVLWKGQWLAVAAWSAAALHLKARDKFIGWTEEQRRQRLALVVNNSRLCVLPDCHYPNLVSRFMKLMLGRLSADWQSTWGHPVALAESFVAPELYRGTAYKVSGWSQLGQTRGWKRSAVDFYQKHDQPKQVWVRELVKNACVKLRAAELPAPWGGALNPVAPRCAAKAGEIASLMERLGREIAEFRRKQALAYPMAGMLALIAMASRVRNPKAAFALSLFRRGVVSFAQVWLEQCRETNPRSRMTTRKFQKQFLHCDGGPERLRALIFSQSPVSWRLSK